ncbi:Glutaredoxin subgroup [Penicillium bovifimosum]|uniref:Glutaredoxin subgroup n=1 Tax=Penicillium bovifimosum TaxID=126998 RepID=A0A9W9KZP4_9EURO|nr:Glutaredoxin subgroup [Penicillium bovifimosum]KAJ5129244.1 Glutaredoxin subgroup [Penicillium bovifimosum]
MPSQRRLRLIVIAVIALLFMVFYYTDEASKIQNQQFYRSTLAAMKAKEQAKNAKSQEKIQKPVPAPGQNGAAVAGDKVPVAEVQKAAIPPATENEDTEEIPIAGRTKMTVPKKVNQPSEVQKPAKSEEEKEREEREQKEAEATTELNAILKRSPIIIFSKSYCPYSKRAKSILLEHYSIQPPPFVVELDQHPLGPNLQALLAQSTGRRTVPNVLVNGKSIGGGDDVAALDQSDELASTLRQMGGKWIADVSRQEVDNSLPKVALSDAQSRDIQFRSTTKSIRILNLPDIDNLHPRQPPKVTSRCVKVHIKSRVVTVEGPRGKLVKDLSHIAVTFGRPEKNVISIELHHGARKGVATLRTVRTIINNLMIGVTRGFKYKMRYVYAHFPINVNIEPNPETGRAVVEIRNFLGEKYVRRITAQPDVDIAPSANVKDELILTGNSLEGVSQSAADIQQICRVRNKDIRKFLDGLYVSEKGNIIEE